MPLRLKRNSLFAFVLALLFWGAFMFAKHDPVLRPIIPFGDDPYDAVGSFAVIVGLLIAVIALVRAFWPYRDRPSDEQTVYLVRSQEAVALAVFVTLGADAIAMARHPALWMHAARGRLLCVLGIMAAAALLAHFTVTATWQRKAPRRAWITASVVTLACALGLALYPESWIGHLVAHLLTVLAGAVILFASMAVLLRVAVPFDAADKMARAPSPHRWGWAIVAAVGLLAGVAAFLGEMSEGVPGFSLARLLFVAAVFVGLGLGGLLIAYAFLARPLGLRR